MPYNFVPDSFQIAVTAEVDFLLALIEFFSVGVTAEELRAIID